MARHALIRLLYHRRTHVHSGASIGASWLNREGPSLRVAHAFLPAVPLQVFVLIFLHDFSLLVDYPIVLTS